MKNKILSIFLCFIPFYTIGQWFDSSQVGSFRIIEPEIVPLDSSFSIVNYLDLLEFRTDTFGVITMGNQGDVRRSLNFRHLLEVRPNIGLDGYFKNMPPIQLVPMYNVFVPMGGIRMQNGYEKGQMFGLYFTFNTHERFNFFIDFQRNNSRGYFLNQQNKADQLLLSSTYASENLRYSLALLLSSCWSENTEFGGISDRGAFESRQFDLLELYSVRLNNSFSRAYKSEFAAQQHYKLNSKGDVNDIGVFIDLGWLRQRFEFETSDPNLMSAAAIDEVQANDSIHFTRIESFGGFYLSSKKKIYQFKAGAHHTYYNYSNNYLGLAENLFGLRAEIAGRIKDLNFSGMFQNYLTGSFIGTYQLKSNLSYKPKNIPVKFSAFLNQGLMEPGMFYQRYAGNFFFWNNSLNRIFVNQIGGSAGYGNHTLSAGAYLMDSYLFFNHAAIPQRLDEFTSVIYAEGKSDLTFGKFGLMSRIRFQTTDQSEFVRIPNWVIREVFYYQRPFFKSRLKMQTGVDFQYFSSFMSEAFMPLTSVMFLQDEQFIGNFPYITFFVGLNIREFSIFFRLENITDNLLPINYYAAPHYPLPPFNFRFGATWTFFN